MIKIYCDSCEKEANEKDFKFEAILREIKYPASVLTASPQKPVLVEKSIHLCRKCYESKFKEE